MRIHMECTSFCVRYNNVNISLASPTHEWRRFCSMPNILYETQTPDLVLGVQCTCAERWTTTPVLSQTLCRNVPLFDLPHSCQFQQPLIFFYFISFNNNFNCSPFMQCLCFHSYCNVLHNKMIVTATICPLIRRWFLSSIRQDPFVINYSKFISARTKFISLQKFLFSSD